MREKPRADLVVGVGEVGAPLADVLSLTRSVVRKDIGAADFETEIETMHVCLPFGDDFVESVAAYIAQFRPGLTIVHSTIRPGATRHIARHTGAPVAYSPVRGRHGEMRRDLMRFTKFVSAPDGAALDLAVQYLSSVGFVTAVMEPCEALELAKLVETSYSGLLIAWSQELSRYCAALDADLTSVLEFTREVDWLPEYFFQPGYIGGHCIMQNLDLLEQVRRSPFLDAVRWSNDQCTPAQKECCARYQPRRL